MRKGDVGCDSQCCKTHVTPHQKVGMSKVACHRMPVGGGHGEARQTLKDARESHEGQPFNYAREKCNEIVSRVQCGSMEAKA